MADKKIKNQQEELKDEQLDQVAGGINKVQETDRG